MIESKIRQDMRVCCRLWGYRFVGICCRFGFIKKYFNIDFHGFAFWEFWGQNFRFDPMRQNEPHGCN